jgi:hypothetical protein
MRVHFRASVGVIAVNSELICEWLYLHEMDGLLVDAMQELLTQAPDIQIYTISIWTDPNAAASAVDFDTLENSNQVVQRSNAWNKGYYDKYMASGDEEQARLFLPSQNRNQNPANFQFDRAAFVKHDSFNRLDWPMQIAGGDKPVASPIWPVLEVLLKTVQERAKALYRDLTLHPDAKIAVNSPHSWYDHELSMLG